MFNYLKQALDSVENQLDSILDTNQTDTNVVSVTAQNVGTTSDSNRLSIKLKKLKEKDKKENTVSTTSVTASEGEYVPQIEKTSDSQSYTTETKNQEYKNVTVDENSKEHGWVNENVLEIENEIVVDELNVSMVSELEKESISVGKSVPENIILSVIHPKNQMATEAQKESLIHSVRETDTLMAVIPPENQMEAIAEKIEIPSASVDVKETTDDDSGFKTQIDTLKNSLEIATGQYNTLLQESNTKLETLQKRIQEYENEIQALKKQLSSSIQTSQDKIITEITKKLSEKEGSIVGLLQEGENLAKEILRANNTIKKYKKDLQDTKNDVDVKSKQIEQYQEKIQQIQLKVTELSTQESQLQDNVVELKDSKKQLERKVGELEMIHVKQNQEIVDLKTKSDLLQSELDNLKKEQHTETIAIQSKALEEQLKVNAALESQLQTAKQIAQDLQFTMQKITIESQTTITSLRTEFHGKEEMLQRRIQMLENKIHDVEGKNEEMVMLSQEATAPLLQQISTLESLHHAAKADWEANEAILLKRCQVAEKELFSMTSSLKSSQELISTLQGDFSRLEKANKELSVQHEASQLKIKESNNSQNSSNVQVVQLESQLNVMEQEKDREIESLKKEHGLEIVKLRKEYELKILQLSSSNTSLSPLNSPAPEPTVKKNVAGLALSNLKTQLNQSKGQVQSLELQLQQVTDTRDQLTNKLSELIETNTILQEEISKTNELKTQLQDLDIKYSTVLELLGEKEERIMELEDDIQDMKVAFRAVLEK